MCGIVAYIGPREAYPVIMKGLKRLEYRGYDSAGVALLDDNNLRVYKNKDALRRSKKVLSGKTCTPTPVSATPDGPHTANPVTVMRIHTFLPMGNWP
ncbi:MAG: hypothetical protein WDM78_00230 [Puia sp.]